MLRPFDKFLIAAVGYSIASCLSDGANDYPTSYVSGDEPVGSALVLGEEGKGGDFIARRLALDTFSLEEPVVSLRDDHHARAFEDRWYFMPHANQGLLACFDPKSETVCSSEFPAKKGQLLGDFTVFRDTAYVAATDRGEVLKINLNASSSDKAIEERIDLNTQFENSEEVFLAPLPMVMAGHLVFVGAWQRDRDSMAILPGSQVVVIDAETGAVRPRTIPLNHAAVLWMAFSEGMDRIYASSIGLFDSSGELAGIEVINPHRCEVEGSISSSELGGIPTLLSVSGAWGFVTVDFSTVHRFFLSPLRSGAQIFMTEGEISGPPAWAEGTGLLLAIQSERESGFVKIDQDGKDFMRIPFGRPVWIEPY